MAAALAGLFIVWWTPAAGREQGARTRFLAAWLGPAEVVLGPDQRIDNPFHTLGVPPGQLAYVANVRTFGFQAPDLEHLVALPTPVIGPGPAGQFDSCGAWLNSTAELDDRVVGWYHAETECAYPVTRKSVAYAESDDGRTFEKPGYPANRVIAAPSRLSGPTAGSEGDHRVIRVGDYFYLYFLAARDDQVRLARSAVQDAGRPGTWRKLYRGAFSEPGVGGESSPIAPGILARSWVSYSDDLGAFVGISRLDDGWGLAVSPDGVTDWHAATDVLLHRPAGVGVRRPSSGELVEYPSLIGLDGASDRISSEFWLYYMRLGPGERFEDGRSLMRRRVRLDRPASFDRLDDATWIALSAYRNGGSGDRWATTGAPERGDELVDTLGYLATTRVDGGMEPLFDCLDQAANDRWLDRRSDCGGDRSGMAVAQRAGWVWTAPVDGAREIFRCRDAETADRFASLDAACGGSQVEASLGHLAAPHGAD